MAGNETKGENRCPFCGHPGVADVSACPLEWTHWWERMADGTRVPPRHGHVRSLLHREAVVAKCGGPGICRVCAAEKAYVDGGVVGLREHLAKVAQATVDSSNNRADAGVPRKKPGTFEKGDPRINKKGRPSISEEQREFRRELHKMAPQVLKVVRAKLMEGKPRKLSAADSAVLNKLIDKLGGADAINVRVAVEKEQAEFLRVAKERLTPEAYEALLAAYNAQGGDGE